MAVIRTKNRVGKRFIRLCDLCDYAVDLDLCTHPPAAGLMEFLEANGLLTPVRRIQLPPEILQRITKEGHADLPVIDPIEPDGPRLDAAADLMNALNMDRWTHASIFGESVHALDAIAPAWKCEARGGESPIGAGRGHSAGVAQGLEIPKSA